MANAEMWDFLSEVVPDYDVTLSIKRKMTPEEEGQKNQVVHLGDDDSEEVISFSDDSIFYVNIPWDMLKESESGTIYDWYHDSTKGNGIARSFKWIHYGERTDQHTYTVRFALKMSRTLMSGDVHSMKNIRLRILGKAPSDIGAPGAQGFGVGTTAPPTGFSSLTGTAEKDNDNYGNYQYQDGSIMCWIPKFYYKISTLAIDIKGTDTYLTTAAANADGYALHRAFIDGDAEKDGFFIDKYMCSQNTYGGNEIASSIANGLPISTHADHNPIANLTACPVNAYYESINAANARGSLFSVASRFQHAALAMLSMAHGQASSATTHCAWYDGTYNFPKGCNNNALGDADDGTISYTTDGYSNCGKTGSGTPFAKTTHNGQACGVADLNGLMWEISLGVTAITADDTIEDISRANPANVQETGHMKSTGDLIMLTGIEGGDWTALDDKIYAVTKVNADNYTLDGVDTSGFTLAYVQGTNHGTTTNGTFYVAKQATAMKDFTSGNSGATDHWGATGVAAMMDAFAPAFEIGYASNGFGQYYGSGANQVLGEATFGNEWLLSGLGFPKDKDGIDTTGTNLFGKDYFHQYLKNELCLLSCGNWAYYSGAGVWHVRWSFVRGNSSYNVGFRCACYPD